MKDGPHTMQALDTTDREQAKRVIIEIARYSDGIFVLPKSRVIKIFYLAHVLHAQQHDSTLTDWPLPKNVLERATVEQIAELLNELIDDAIIAETHGTVYLRVSTNQLAPMSSAERASIRSAVNRVAMRRVGD